MIFGKVETKRRIRKRVILSLLRPSSAKNSELELINNKDHNDQHDINNISGILGVDSRTIDRDINNLLKDGFGKKDNRTITIYTSNCCSMSLTKQQAVDLLSCLFMERLNIDNKRSIEQVATKESLQEIGAIFYKGISIVDLKAHFQSTFKWVDYAIERLKELSEKVAKKNETLGKTLSYNLKEFESFSQRVLLNENFENYVIFSMQQVFAIFYAIVKALEWERFRDIRLQGFDTGKWSLNAAAVIFKGIKDELVPISDSDDATSAEIAEKIRQDVINKFSNNIYCQNKAVQFFEDINSVEQALNGHDSMCGEFDFANVKSPNMIERLIHIFKAGDSCNFLVGSQVYKNATIKDLPSGGTITIVSKDEHGHNHEVTLAIADINNNITRHVPRKHKKIIKR